MIDCRPPPFPCTARVPEKLPTGDIMPTIGDETNKYRLSTLVRDSSSSWTRPKNFELPNNLPTSLTPIADYLRKFNEHVCGELKKGFASNYDRSKYRYCLTVPAMWSDRAKSAMREAAIRADIVQRHDPLERLMLISEPEAAALYCEKKSEQFNLAHGQRFLICDAGGGTVDLIVFEIDQPVGGR